MPEGDTLHATAAALHRALGGSTVERIEGSDRGVRAESTRLTGRRVESVESIGKHLLVHFERDWSLRTHLGMPGSWHLYRPGERWRVSAGKARVVIRTAEWVAVCFAAPTVVVGPRERVVAGIAHLGPDLMSDDFDESRFLARAATAEGTTISDLLLDQRVLAGIGNVIKSETLFLEGIHPAVDADSLDQDDLLRLARRARRLLLANRKGGARNTTGDRGPGRESWVYGRRRRPCRRCGTPIVGEEIGGPPRITYWCPRCQPEH